MSSIRIAFYDAKSYDKNSFKQVINKLKFKDRIEIQYIDSRLTGATVSYSKGYDAVCVFVNDDLGAEILAELADQGIRMILLRCAGFDRLDIRAANELNLAVTRVPAYSPHAVAEFATALLLTLNRKVHRSYNRVRDSNFSLSGLVGFDLFGKTIGVVGTGKIGMCFIQIMIGFGCNILAYDLFPNDELKKMKKAKYVPLEELFQKSDIISLHAPATPETTNMINYSTINLMKPGVIIINTSRGVLIDSKALIEGLLSKRIGGAGLDVYHNEKKYFFRDVSEEDIDDDILARLQNMRNVIITSHQAFLTDEALNAIASTTMQSVKEYFIDELPLAKLTYRVEPPPENPAVARVLLKRRSSEEGFEESTPSTQA